jgi:adenylate cyclase
MARQYEVSGNKGDPRREEAILRLCGRATEIDPSYARAWALIAYAQWSLRYARGRSGDNGLAAAERAVLLDPTLAEPHAVKARILFSQGQREEAAAELELALSLDPDSSLVNLHGGIVAVSERRYEDAIRFFSKAAALDEGDFSSAAMLTSCFKALGDREGARHSAQTALARAEKVLAQDPSNGYAMAFGACSLAVLGEADRFKQWIDRALLIDPDNMLMRYNFACALSADFKDANAALELLGPVFAKVSVVMLKTIETDPDLDPIRDDPRFIALLADAKALIAAQEAG